MPGVSRPGGISRQARLVDAGDGRCRPTSQLQGPGDGLPCAAVRDGVYI